ncbi:MAG: hypothetical protein RLZZ142_1373 [Verrucomicrobiota bacterium]
MLSLSAALALVAEKLAHARLPLPPPIPLNEAAGRFLAHDLLAPENLPAFDRSAMDGYVIRSDDPSPSFAITQILRPGQPPAPPIPPGNAARIFTGALLPLGGPYQVIPQENTTAQDHLLRIHTPTDRPWIRFQGEDAKAGQLLLSRGTPLRAGELSLLASLGATLVQTTPLPRVLHLTTGDELVPPGQPPNPGQIRDSNSTLLHALLHSGGAQRVHHTHVPDSLEALVHAVHAQPADAWDALLLSGGASVGDYDFGARALRSLGFTLHFERLNLRPGKPLIFATRNHQLAFVLPGNPVSHFVTYHLVIQRALDALAGVERGWQTLQLPVTHSYPLKPDARETWCPARILACSGTLHVAPLPWQSSGDVSGLARANALLKVAPGERIPEDGFPAECLPLFDL